MSRFLLYSDWKLVKTPVAKGVWVLLCLLVVSTSAFSQDMLIRATGDTLRGKVLDLGVQKIKFRMGANASDPVQEFYKNQVKEIIFESGSRLVIVYNRYEVPKEMTIDEKTVGVKVDVLSPFFDHITAGVEFRVKNQLNVELKAGIIGPGWNSSLDYSKGFLFKAGLKKVWPKERIRRGLKYKHPLEGNYIKPEFTFNNYFYKDEEIGEEVHYVNTALQLLFGHQYIFSDRISFEFFGGAGFGTQVNSYEQDSAYDRHEVERAYSYTHIFFGKNLPIVVSGGVTVGVIF